MPGTRSATQVASGAEGFEPETSSQAAPAAAGPLVQSITREAAMQMRRRLGLAERARLPNGIKHMIETAARDTVETALAVAVGREVTATAKRMVRDSRSPSNDASAPSDLPLLDEGLSLRAVEVSRPLLERAKGLAAEKHALEAAGFSSEEAMRILVAEIAAGGY
jgi:hypothetical protein